MNPELREAWRQLARAGQRFGPGWAEVLDASFLIHGHLCGAMPLGFRAGLAALRALGVEREGDMAHRVFIETGTGHVAGCFADGAQLATGCTFGKDVIERTGYGKWAMTLADAVTGTAVRVSVRPGVMSEALQSPFVGLRRQGVPPTQVPPEVSRPLVQALLAEDDAGLLTVSGIFTYPLDVRSPSCFTTVTCATCGELVAENTARLKDGNPACLPCSGYQP